MSLPYRLFATPVQPKISLEFDTSNLRGVHFRPCCVEGVIGVDRPAGVLDHEGFEFGRARVERGKGDAIVGRKTALSVASAAWSAAPVRKLFDRRSADPLLGDRRAEGSGLARQQPVAASEQPSDAILFRQGRVGGRRLPWRSWAGSSGQLRGLRRLHGRLHDDHRKAFPLDCSQLAARLFGHACERRKGGAHTSSPLTTGLTITGHPIVRLWVNTKVPDLDVFVYLEEVDRRGKSTYLTEGSLRASHRRVSRAAIQGRSWAALPFSCSTRSDAAAKRRTGRS